MGYVYLATNKVNGKQYVGKTVTSFKRRRGQHVASAKAGDGFYLHRAIRKYGPNSFEWRAIYKSSNDEVLQEKEREFIKRLGTKKPNGYNLTDGGGGCCGWSPSKETLEKRGNALRGQVRTKETKDKNSKVSKELWKDPEYREKMLKASANRPPMSSETRAKLSASSKANWEDPEFLAKMQAVNAKRTQDALERKRKRVKKTLKGKTYEDIYGDKADEQREKRSEILRNSERNALGRKKAWDNPERRKKARLSYEERFGPEKAAEIRKKQSDAMKAVQEAKRALQSG